MKIEINRAPVMTLWAAVVAERLGYDRDEALTLGKAVAGLNAQTKGKRLGIYGKAAPEEKSKFHRAAKEAEAGTGSIVALLHREVPTARTRDGLRALSGSGKPEDPAAVQRYLEAKFGDALAEARRAFTALAKSHPRDELAEHAFTIYERFRPEIPAGARGWGAKGVLDLAKVAKMAETGAR